MRSTLVRAVALAALSLSALAGCGGNSGGSNAEPGFTTKSYDDIKAATIADMKNAKSLHMSGTISPDGKAIAIDLSLNTDGECQGTMTISGATASLLGVGGAFYFKGDKNFWSTMAGPSADMITSMVGDKWAKLPGGAGGFSSLCDLDSFVAQLDKDDTKSTDQKVGGTSTVDGQEAVELTSTEEGGTVHVEIATASPHYILSMSKDSGTDAGSLTFTDYDKQLSVQAPDSSDVVDLSSLGG